MISNDAARTPHGDSNSEISRHITLVSWMQPAPLTGTATCQHYCEYQQTRKDAARTPHGDSNIAYSM